MRRMCCKMVQANHSYSEAKEDKDLIQKEAERLLAENKEEAEKILRKRFDKADEEVELGERLEKEMQH